jgi:hypothetical protein
MFLNFGATMSELVRAEPPKKLKSEKVIINAPMSFARAAQGALIGWA